MNKEIKTESQGLEEKFLDELLSKNTKGEQLGYLKAVIEYCQDNQQEKRSLESDSNAEFMKAFVKAQMEFEVVEKTSKNPYFKSTYANYAAIWSHVKPILCKNGIGIYHHTKIDDAVLTVTTTLCHVSGERIESSISYRLPDNKPQTIGSAQTYAMRYNLTALTGIACDNDDDDGNTSSGRESQQKQSLQHAQPAQTKTQGHKKVTPAEGKKLVALAAENGYTKDDLTSIAKSLGYERLEQISYQDYEYMTKNVTENPKC